MTNLTDYQNRVLAQGQAWLEGQSEHNQVDDECCPDFSCCVPQLFVQSREARLQTINQLRESYGLASICDA